MLYRQKRALNPQYQQVAAILPLSHLKNNDTIAVSNLAGTPQARQWHIKDSVSNLFVDGCDMNERWSSLDYFEVWMSQAQDLSQPPAINLTHPCSHLHSLLSPLIPHPTNTATLYRYESMQYQQKPALNPQNQQFAAILPLFHLESQ